jgi:membrane associated rhomboid family serine protease
MIVPLGDEPNPRGVPYMTYAIIAVNVVVYLFVTLPLGMIPPDPQDPALREYLQALSQSLPGNVPLMEVLSQVTAYDLFTFTFGYRPAHPSLVALFTAMFLHGGLLHLIGNMLFLWIYGDNVEHMLGSIAFLFWYLATGVAATLFHAWFDSTSLFPLVGASGAISGVLGFYFIWFPHNRVRLWVFFFPLVNVFLVPARIVLGLYLIVENLLPFLVTRGGAGGVAYGAHIGGFAAGLAVAWIMNRRDIRGRDVRGARVPTAPTGGQIASEPAVTTALREGRIQDAAALYFSLSPEQTRRLLPPEDSIALAEWLRAAGYLRAAITVYQRHLRDYPLGPGAAEAHLGLGLVQLHSLDQPAAAYQHFVEALGLNPSPEIEAAAYRALDEIKARQKFQVGRARTQ